MSKNKSKDLCPCHSGISYEVCCKPFHDGLPPETAVQLMRSRYSAFALGLVDYIIKTTHPLNPDYTKNITSWSDNISEFSKKTEFKDLKILNFENGTTLSYVTFHAFLRQSGQNTGFKERSRFLKQNGQWLYVDGNFIK